LPDIDITPPEVGAYAEAHTTPHPDFMRALAEETRTTLPIPEMLSGHLEGRLLEMLVFASGARRVLELGTYSGYSALAMARGLPHGGRIITCEFDDEHADFAQRHIDASPFADRIEVRRGPALETMKTLTEERNPFDLIFIDADKPNYPAYYEAALPLLADRGLIALDNTLWSGRVLAPDDDRSQLMHDLNERIVNDPRVVCVQLPIRDGITLVRKA
jgi:caffeoyl-CoA O-methyltransferase